MSTRQQTKFAHVVRSTLLENKLAGRQPDSIRSLAKAMGKGDPVRSETFKRSLFKWMKPGEPKPTPASRALVAEALGISRDALNHDDDEEESDPSMREAFNLFVDLMGRIPRQIVQEETRA